MKIAILGYGEQGRSAYEYWQSGNEITVCDQSKTVKLPVNVDKQLGDDYLKGLDKFDLIVRSPALHPRDIVAANSESILDKVTTNTNEFFRVCQSQNIIGITGTKGKGTTSTLVAKMLEKTGKRVHLGGNIGTPPLDLLKGSINTEDFVVLELANFQLIDLGYSPHIAVCLMVVPEHLDWHLSLDEYFKAKQQLFVHQKSQDIAIYFAENENSQKIAGAGAGRKIPYFSSPGAIVEDNQIKINGQIICKTSELKLLGQHNWQNVCAAITVFYQVSKDFGAMRSILTSFTGLEHRLELVGEINGVKFYNDSFAATPDAAMAAIDAITGKKVMIIGGYDRNLPIEHLAKKIAESTENLRKILLIGASTKRLASSLEAVGYSNFSISVSKNMDEIVSEAKKLAMMGDSVVLSPGFPSFDMFKNFEERGNLFKEAIGKL